MWRNTDNSLRSRWRFLALIGLPPLLALAQTSPPAQPFHQLDGCVYKPQRWDDGDSFHVILPDQKELVFRLYFVDAPEEERVYGDRIAEQAAYFGISSDAAIEIDHEASGFSAADSIVIYADLDRVNGSNREACDRFPVYRQSHLEVQCEDHRPFQLLQELRGP